MSGGAFKVGEIAIMQNLVGFAASWNGAEVEIIEDIQRRIHPVMCPEGVMAYKVAFRDMPPAFALEHQLRKKQPPKEEDINTVVSWDQVAWQPTEVPA